MTQSATPAGADVAGRGGVRRSWPLLWAHVRPYRWALVGGGLLSLTTAATGLALPLVVRELVGVLGTDRSASGLIVLMTVLVVANAAIGAVGAYVLARTGESVVLDARRFMLARLVRLRLSAVEDAEPGDLMSRVTADTTLVRTVATESLVNGLTGALTLVATLVLMAVVDVVLLTVTVLVLAAAAAVIGGLVPRINRATTQAQESVGAMGAALERLFGAFRTVKASGAEERERVRVDEAATAAWRAGVGAARWSALAGNTAGLSVQLSFLVVLTVGGGRVAAGAIDVGTLVAFLLYVFYLLSPIGQLTRAATQYQVGAAALARMQQAAELPVEPLGSASAPADDRRRRVDSPPRDPQQPEEREGRGAASVTFDEVRFRYRPGLPLVHDGVSFTVPAGGVTAVVGPSGAGKTSLFALIERFHDPDSGRVLVDGIDVRDLQLARLRAAIGYVEQDAPVLSGTLRENLLYGAPDADDDLMDVVRTARLAELVTRLPDGLDTLVGHRGTKLSGGERQRVATARALLRRPRLLLLDEVTSQLDAVNEAALRDAVADIARTTTVLVVAHRLSTVAMADRIVVMDAGVVRAVGTHAELVAGDPLYAELAATQLLATAD